MTGLDKAMLIVFLSLIITIVFGVLVGIAEERSREQLRKKYEGRR